MSIMSVSHTDYSYTSYFTNTVITSTAAVRKLLCSEK